MISMPARRAAWTSYGVSPTMMISAAGTPARSIAAATMSGSGFDHAATILMSGRTRENSTRRPLSVIAWTHARV
jgi:hypothetical protein